MKKQILLFALSIALTACGSKEIHLIKEHVKQDYFSDPTAKFDFEEIRKDSVHTVGDSINYY
ncbi:MAG TPA: hypothetical protein GX005_07230, partial [Bacteroidales bacterium]|nr:hypothetical protein [Bacteroidales bacterium]